MARVWYLEPIKSESANYKFWHKLFITYSKKRPESFDNDSDLFLLIKILYANMEPTLKTPKLLFYQLFKHFYLALTVKRKR